MDKKEFKEMLARIDIYDQAEYNKVVAMLKHNLCQNMRIARKLSKMEPEYAA